MTSMQFIVIFTLLTYKSLKKGPERSYRQILGCQKGHVKCIKQFAVELLKKKVTNL